ncbi:MAG: hypothetical protein MRZ66_05900 [Clostridiales bacterium]|nr:hypothetical protein [Clostridiales bacterium]
MIDGILIVMFYLVLFTVLLGIGSAIVNIYEYIYFRQEKYRPIAEDVRRVKIKPDDWVSRYFAGEFYPEDEKPKRSDKPVRKFVM